MLCVIRAERGKLSDLLKFVKPRISLLSGRKATKLTLDLAQTALKTPTLNSNGDNLNIQLFMGIEDASRGSVYAFVRYRSREC